MSVTLAHSPLSGAKRHFEEHDQPDPHDRASYPGLVKRGRYRGSPAAGRCVQFGAAPTYYVSPSNVAALRALFPHMDETALSAVLADCGDNIDAAIKCLTELKLSADGASTSARQQQQEALEPASQPAEADAAPREPEPLTGDQWVEFMVQQMAAATSLDDARAKAAAALQRFEAYTAKRLASGAAAPAGATATPGGTLEQLQRENQILKRAVQIQNAKLQEREKAEADVVALKGLLAQYQEQLHREQLNSYSLALHLRQATAAGMHGPQPPHPPDVF